MIVNPLRPGLWGYGATNLISVFAPYGINGIHLQVSASDINPSPGVYNFESVIGSQLDDLIAAGLQGGIAIAVGQNTPAHIMSIVGTFDTTGGTDDGPYPYYFNPTYTSWYYDIYSRLFNWINAQSDPRKNCVKYVETNEGSTGDPQPYKGTPTNYNYAGQTSISDPDWLAYKKLAWAQFGIYNAQNITFCQLMFNPGNTNENTDYLLANFPGCYLKNGISSHQITFDGEVVTQQNTTTGRGEMQTFFTFSEWQVAPLQLDYALFASMSALNLDIANAGGNFLAFGGASVPLFDFGNRYIGLDISAGYGMIALKDTPDFSDTDRFDEGTYGPVIDPARLTQYNNRVALLTSTFGASAPSYLDWLLVQTTRTYLNPARKSAIVIAVAPTGAQDVPGFAPYDNDCGVGLLTNYEKFLYQYSPNTTSRGVYRLGPNDGVNLYGRFSRSTDHANALDEMFFYVDAGIVGVHNYTITLRVTYYDTSGYEWSLNYRDQYGPAVAYTNTNGSTNTWLRRDITLTNLEGKAYTFDTDFSIKYESGGDTPIALIEFLDVIENTPPADLPPTVVIDTPDTTLYQPDNSLAVTATVTPAYLHSIVFVLWTYISGPATYAISSPATADTTFGNLVIGTYRFRLTGTQDDAQTASDDILIIVIATQTGVKYIMRWLNRQKDTYRVELKPKNYSNIDREITGTDTPFKLKYQSGDGDIYSAIRASEATIQFWTDGNIAIEDFYNDDDTFWQVFFYGEQIDGEVAADVLLWTGFLQMDNSGEALQDYAHPISLNANDNLGLLKNIALPAPTLDERYTGILLTELFALIMSQATLQLDTNAYLNIFENSTQDRSDVDTIDLLQQTVIYTSNLINTDGTYKNCFDILEGVLTSFEAAFYQSFGKWTIARQGEFRLFTDSLVPGTSYGTDFEVQDAIILDPLVTIGRDLEILPINENQSKIPLRPLQFAKKTFNYVEPVLIAQVGLQLPPGAIPYDTHIDSGIRYDDYSIATYFPDWKQTHGDTSYLEVATDVATNNETDRYIVTPCPSPDLYRGVQFNNIPVTANDSFDFSLQFKTFTDSGDNFFFRIRFDLITATHYWTIDVNESHTSDINVTWAGPFTRSNWDDAKGAGLPVLATSQTSKYQQWSLASFVESGGRLPLIPDDGILLIEVRGDNATEPSEPHITTQWKSVNLNFTNAVNRELNVIGQVHTQTQPIEAKNNSDVEITYDDSPRNTINGTYLRTPLVDFDANIGELYFYRTLYWHRATIDEAWRLNQIQTFDELFIQRKMRTRVEGDWFGLRYPIEGGWQYLSLQNILKINFLETLNFIFGIVEFDYMSCTWNATLYECFDDGEEDSDLSNTYTFTYLYKTN